MKSLVTLQNISKSFGAKELFSQLSLSFYEKEQTALTGHNGSGKSTLLKILSGLETADEGEVVSRRGLKVSYLTQDHDFSQHKTLIEAMGITKESPSEKVIDAQMQLSLSGFKDDQANPNSLSGGWKKRLAIAKALMGEPELFLMDEPTNHMDWDGIQWLVDRLSQAQFSYVIISHDRDFLKKTTQRTIEISAAFPNNHLSFPVSFDAFQDKKAQYLMELKQQIETLSNQSKRELEWLRAGVKARTTKSRSRMKEAYELFERLESKQRKLNHHQKKIKIQVEETHRQTKKLIETKNLSFHYQEAPNLFKDVNLVLSPNSKVGILGPNGSGKTTLVQLLLKKLTPSEGTVLHSRELKSVTFNQNKNFENEEQTVFSYLGDDSDNVVFLDRSLHVASYAKMFLFNQDHFYLKIRQLSGGEKARLLLAKALLNPFDILILDEPTNDLDIDSIIALEETLKDLSACLILISHDRRFLENTCDRFIAIHSDQSIVSYADIDQWIKGKASSTNNTSAETFTSKKSEKKKIRLSYKEKQFLESVEEDILKLEDKLASLNEKLLKPELQNDKEKMRETLQELDKTQKSIDKKYSDWDELEKKQNQS